MKVIDPHPIELFTTEELLREITKRTKGFVFVGLWADGKLSMSGVVDVSIRSTPPWNDEERAKIRSGLQREMATPKWESKSSEYDPNSKYKGN